MSNITSIAVYCGSSEDVAVIYQDAAKSLGRLLALHNIKLIYGGASDGLMGEIAKSCTQHKGYVCGVIPSMTRAQETCYEQADEIIYVDSMHDRKKVMYDMADAFIALPGGLGTLDEICEIMAWKQIGLHSKEIFILNIDNYWGKFFKEFFVVMQQEKFIQDSDKALFKICDSVEIVNSYLSDVS